MKRRFRKALYGAILTAVWLFLLPVLARHAWRAYKAESARHCPDCGGYKETH